MVEPLLTSGQDQISWPKGVRRKPTGDLADVVFKWTVLDKVSKMGDLDPLIRRLQYLRSLDGMPSFEDNNKEYRRRLKGTFQLRKGNEWSEEEIEENYGIEEKMVGNLRRDGKWGAWLRRMIGLYYDFWRVVSRERNAWQVRRAWLCLIILGKTFERPSGYTRVDIGSLARVKSRGAARNILKRLLKIGTLREIKKGQPRYEYIDTISSETADKVIDAYYLSKIRRLTRWVNDALEETPTTERQLRELPCSIYVAGGPEPPVWVYRALSEALVLASIALEIALDLPPEGDLHPPERTVDEFLSEIGRRANGEGILEPLCNVSKRVFRPEWEKWEDALDYSKSEPVLIANLRSFMGERIPLSDEPKSVSIYEPDTDKLFERERRPKKKED